jgi:hypothetical protein
MVFLKGFGEVSFKGVRKVLDVIVGILKNRAISSDEEPDRKRAKIETYRTAR